MFNESFIFQRNCLSKWQNLFFPPFHPLESLWQLIRIYLFNESWNLNFPNWTFLNFSNHCCGICKPCISTSTYGRKTLGQFYCWQFALHLHLFQACLEIQAVGPNITSQNNGKNAQYPKIVFVNPNTEEEKKAKERK